VSDAGFLHTLTPAESDALEEMGDDVLLAERGPGELLGDLAGIDGQPRSASATAVDEVRGLLMPLRAFRGFLMDHPRVASSLLELLSRRLREAEARRVS
jgi:CRP/FNR family transcriptional regulator, cyclic AMP receptor protein